jgi:hypothetical protein
MADRIKYAARLEHVREVSLVGTADLAYWTGPLHAENLVPAEQGGRAQLLLVAADSKFLGIRFTELSFSVLVALPGEAEGQGAYLAQAFNSVRFFAFCERALFKTPYHHGRTSVKTSLPAAVDLAVGERSVFRVAMGAGAGARTPIRGGADGWSGPVFLPGREKLFYATVQGHTETFPFVPAEDSMAVEPACPILQALVDSNFTPSQWAIRPDASHAKSKTYKRAPLQSQVAQLSK